METSQKCGKLLEFESFDTDSAEDLPLLFTPAYLNILQRAASKENLPPTAPVVSILPVQLYRRNQFSSPSPSVVLMEPPGRGRPSTGCWLDCFELLNDIPSARASSPCL